MRLGPCPFAWTPGVGRSRGTPLHHLHSRAGIVHEVPSPPGTPSPLLSLHLRSTTRTAWRGGPTIFSPSLPARRFSPPPVASPRCSPRGVLGSSRREPTAAPKRPPLLSNASAFVEFGIPFSAARAVCRRGNAAATRALVVLVPLCPSKIVWIRLPVLLSPGVFTEPRSP